MQVLLGVKDAGLMTRYFSVEENLASVCSRPRRRVNTGAVQSHAGSWRLSSRIQNGPRRIKQIKALHWQTLPAAALTIKGYLAHWQTGLR